MPPPTVEQLRRAEKEKRKAAVAQQKQRVDVYAAGHGAGGGGDGGKLFAPPIQVTKKNDTTANKAKLVLGSWQRDTVFNPQSIGVDMAPMTPAPTTAGTAPFPDPPAAFKRPNGVQKDSAVPQPAQGLFEKLRSESTDGTVLRTDVSNAGASSSHRSSSSQHRSRSDKHGSKRSRSRSRSRSQSQSRQKSTEPPRGGKEEKPRSRDRQEEKSSSRDRQTPVTTPANKHSAKSQPGKSHTGTARNLFGAADAKPERTTQHGGADVKVKHEDVVVDSRTKHADVKSGKQEDVLDSRSKYGDVKVKREDVVDSRKKYGEVKVKHEDVVDIRSKHGEVTVKPEDGRTTPSKQRTPEDRRPTPMSLKNVTEVEAVLREVILSSPLTGVSTPSHRRGDVTDSAGFRWPSEAANSQASVTSPQRSESQQAAQQPRRKPQLVAPSKPGGRRRNSSCTTLKNDLLISEESDDDEEEEAVSPQLQQTAVSSDVPEAGGARPPPPHDVFPDSSDSDSDDNSGSDSSSSSDSDSDSDAGPGVPAVPSPPAGAAAASPDSAQHPAPQGEDEEEGPITYNLANLANQIRGVKDPGGALDQHRSPPPPAPGAGTTPRSPNTAARTDVFVGALLSPLAVSPVRAAPRQQRPASSSDDDSETTAPHGGKVIPAAGRKQPAKQDTKPAQPRKSSATAAGKKTPVAAKSAAEKPAPKKRGRPPKDKSKVTDAAAAAKPAAKKRTVEAAKPAAPAPLKKVPKSREFVASASSSGSSSSDSSAAESESSSDEDEEEKTCVTAAAKKPTVPRRVDSCGDVDVPSLCAALATPAPLLSPLPSPPKTNKPAAAPPRRRLGVSLGKHGDLQMVVRLNLEVYRAATQQKRCVEPEPARPVDLGRYGVHLGNKVPPTVNKIPRKKRAAAARGETESPKRARTEHNDSADNGGSRRRRRRRLNSESSSASSRVSQRSGTSHRHRADRGYRRQTADREPGVSSRGRPDWDAPGCPPEPAAGDTGPDLEPSTSNQELPPAGGEGGDPGASPGSQWGAMLLAGTRQSDYSERRHLEPAQPDLPWAADGYSSGGGASPTPQPAPQAPAGPRERSPAGPRERSPHSRERGASSASRDRSDSRNRGDGDRRHRDKYRGRRARDEEVTSTTARGDVIPIEDSLLSANEYLRRARRLKHDADHMQSRVLKPGAYVEAVLAFVQYGHAMEADSFTEPKAVLQMYEQTLKLLKHSLHTSNQYICNSLNNDSAEMQNYIKMTTILSLRLQAFLNFKVYRLKKTEAQKLRKIIEEHNASRSKSSGGSLPSPYQPPGGTSSNTVTSSTSGSAQPPRSNGTPSPISPQPSPAGSVGSVGSVTSASGCCETRSAPAAPPAVGSSTVNVPHRIHSVTQDYLRYILPLQTAHDLWDQADALVTHSQYRQRFFASLDASCGRLTLQSPVPELVRYVRQGLHRLKAATEPPAATPGPKPTAL